MYTGKVIKQRVPKNNRADRKNRGSNSNDRLSTIDQPLIKPLRIILLSQCFQSRYFLMLSTIIQGLLLFMLCRLEQTCLFNSVD